MLPVDESWLDDYIDDNCVGDHLKLGSEDSEIHFEEEPAVDYFAAEGEVQGFGRAK